MANEQFTQLAFNNSPSTSAVVYVVDNNGNNYQTTLNTFTGQQIKPNTYYLVTNPNQFCTSGNLTSSGSFLNNELLTMSGYILSLINAQKNGVLSINSISGVLTIKGTGNVNVILNGNNIILSGSTGTFYSVSNPNNFSSSGNVENTGTLIQNEIWGLSGALNQTGSTLYNDIKSFSGYLTGIASTNIVYIQPNLQIIDFKTVTNGSYVNIPPIGNNVIPAHGIKAGDIFQGEFAYVGAGPQGFSNIWLQLKIQNNLISGYFSAPAGASTPLYNFVRYRLFAASPSQLYLTPVLSNNAGQTAVNNSPFDFTAETNFPYLATSVSIDSTQPCLIDLVGLDPVGNENITGYMAFSLLKKL